MSRTDMVGQGHSRLAIMPADKTALIPETKLEEARIVYDDPLQVQQLVSIQRLATRFSDARPHR